MVDRTSYTQCLMHLIKGNLGAGLLAMPASFAHTGLVGAIVGLPFLCLISGYCVHALIRSAQKIEDKSKGQAFSRDQVNYSKLARGTFEYGPDWARKFGHFTCRSVDTYLLVTQIGVCCIYIVFVVDNVTSILASYSILVPKTLVFLSIFPVTLMLSFIRTLARLSVASLLANLLQAIGLALIVEYLLRDLSAINLADRDNFRPISEVALGFGSAMFAFEGISVVLPLYSRMRRPHLMYSCLGVVNLSFLVILLLYFLVGLSGYLKFGHHVRDSITLNLPATPLYDAVRAMFTASILLSYPLQFYVPNEIIWNWAKKNLLKPKKRSKISKNNSSVNTSFKSSLVVISPGTKVQEAASTTDRHNNNRVAPIENGSRPIILDNDKIAAEAKLGKELARFEEPSATNNNLEKLTEQRRPKATTTTTNGDTDDNAHDDEQYEVPLSYEYLCRLIIVLLTFTLAMTVPKLNLLMDLIGSFSGAALCLTIPAIIHLVAFWDDTKGFMKACMILVDGFLIIGSILSGLGGSASSLISIIKSFNH